MVIDEKFLHANAKNDRDSFLMFYYKFYTTILNFLYRRTNSLSVAEDLTAEVFYLASQKVRDLDENKISFTTLIHKIAVQILISYSKKKAKYEFGYLQSFGSYIPSYVSKDLDDANFNKLNQNQQAFNLQKSLAGLSLEDQVIFDLRNLQKLKKTDISKILGIKEKKLNVKLVNIVDKISRSQTNEKRQMDPSKVDGLFADIHIIPILTPGHESRLRNAIYNENINDKPSVKFEIKNKPFSSGNPFIIIMFILIIVLVGVYMLASGLVIGI